MTIEQLQQELSEPILIGDRPERWERHAMEVAQELAEARRELTKARGLSSGINASSEDKRRVQIEFDSKDQAYEVQLLENIQYILNRRIEMLREVR